jgi:hypothetical protein
MQDTIFAAPIASWKAVVTISTAVSSDSHALPMKILYVAVSRAPNAARALQKPNHQFSALTGRRGCQVATEARPPGGDP